MPPKPARKRYRAAPATDPLSLQCRNGLCVFESKSGRTPPGVHRLTLDEYSQEKLAEFLEEPHEVGGTIVPVITHEDSFLQVKAAKGGDKDSVVIPTDVYQFHTHPNLCQSRDNCYFEFPSENDMSLIAEDSMNGVLAHFVVTHGGIYRVAIKPALRMKLARLTPAKRKQRTDQIFTDFKAHIDGLQAEVAKYPGDPNDIMPKMRDKFLAFADQQQFDVTLTPSPAHIDETVRTV